MSESSPFYLVVRLSDHALALPVAQVVEICRVPALQPGKGEAPGLLGLAVLRGTPTAVFDLGDLLGFPADQATASEPSAQPATEARLVTVRMTSDGIATATDTAAFLVDEVIGLRQMTAERIHSIALPGDRNQRIGEFDQEFARLIDSSGLVPQDAWQLNTGEQTAEAAQ